MSDDRSSIPERITANGNRTSENGYRPSEIEKKVKTLNEQHKCVA